MNIAMRLSSSALCKSVVASTSDLIGGSTRPSISCRRGKTYVAAQEPSDYPKKRRRIPLEERKAMVQCYVDKYRATYPGKFPPPTEVWREVGGSYYIIKKLVEELQHRTKISFTSTVETQGKAIKDGKRLSGSHHLSTSNITIPKNVHQDGRTTETRDGNLSSKESGTVCSVELPLVVSVEEEHLIQRDAQASSETESAKNDESLHEVEIMKFFQSESDKQITENSCESAVGSDLPKATKNDESLHGVKEIRFFQSKSDVTIASNSCESAASNVCSDLPKATTQFIRTTSLEKMESPSSIGDTRQVSNVINDEPKVAAADFQQDFNNSEDNAKMQDSELDKVETEPEPEPGQLHQTQKLGTVTRETSKHHADGAEVGKKSNMWNNLKSFADGIFSLFRKQ